MPLDRDERRVVVFEGLDEPVPPTISATDASTRITRKKMSVIDVNTSRI